MKKSGFLLFLIISLSLAAFFAGYIMVRRGTDTTTNSKTGSILAKFNGDGQPVTEDLAQTDDEIKPVPLTERRVISPVNSSVKGEIMYFEKNTGRLFKLNLETKSEQPVLDKMLLNFVSALWSPSKKELIGTFISGSKTIFKYYNIDTQKEIPFDSGVDSVAFSRDGSLVAFHYSDPTASQSHTGKIVMSNPDGEYPKTVLNTRLKGITLNWPTKDNIAFTTTAAGSEIFLLSESGKLSKALDLKSGLESKWSPSGNNLLYSYNAQDTEEQISTLTVKDMSTGEEKILVTGFASKCAWSIDDLNVYCATPKSPSVDEIYRINTSDGTSKLVAEPFTQVKELFLSPAENDLYYINASDDRLYSIKIAD